MVQKSDWKLIYSRGMSIQRAIDFSLSIGIGFKKAFGFGLMNHRFVRYKDNIEGFCLEDEFNDFVERLGGTLLNKSFYDKLLSEWEWGFKAVRELPRIADCTKDSNDELANKLLKVRAIKARLFIIPWYTFMIEKPLDEKLSEIILKYPGMSKESLLLMTKQTLMLREQLDLLRIAEKPSRKKIDAHARKYAFIPMYDVDYKPYDYHYFKNKFNKIKKPAEQRKRLILDLKSNKKRFMDELKNTSKADRSFLEFVNLIIWLREEKITLRNREAEALKPFYEEIGRRLSFSLTETISLTYDELIRGLKGAIISRVLVDARKKYYELLISRDKITISTEKKNKAFEQETDTNTLTGQVACKGLARGTAKIILNAKELDKISKGDIMVTPMTKPDFIVAIRKIAAIVTDEGGITSHAAIVSRELNKPCIIGTKIATKVFKDGDVVEVDANNGVVRKIK